MKPNMELSGKTSLFPKRHPVAAESKEVAAESKEKE
jgi:hypothetical protein